MSKLRKRRPGDKKEPVSHAEPEVEKPSVVFPSFGWAAGEEDWRGSVLVFSLVLTVYWATMFPWMTGGDSGELVTAACNLGMAHPPGYPTFTLLAHGFLKIFSFSSPAYQINFMSAIFGALTAVLISKAVFMLTKSRGAGLLAAVLFAFNPTVWLYSTQGEVFALNNLLSMWMLLATVQFFAGTPLDNDTTARHPSLTVAYTGAFICGLATTNQHTTVFFILPIVCAVLVQLLRFNLLHIRSFLFLALAGLAGIAPYVYLPLTAHTKPMDGWGDQRTWHGFRRHFFREEYGTFRLAATGESSLADMLLRYFTYCKVLQEESLYVAGPLALLGCVWLFTRKDGRRWSGGVLTSCWVVYLGIFHYLANLDITNPLYLGVQARFWMQPNLVVAVLSGVGLYCAVCFVLSRVRTSWLLQVPWLAVIVITLTTLQVSSNYTLRNQSQSTVYQAYTKRLLDSFPPNSIVLLRGDLNNNLLKYAQQCEGRRADLSLISLELMSWDWYVTMQQHHFPNVVFPALRYHPRLPGSFSIRQFLDANSHLPVYLCGGWKYGDQSHAGFYENNVCGICDVVLPTGRSPKVATLRKGWQSVVRTHEVGEYKEAVHTNDTWEYVVFRDVYSRGLVLGETVGMRASQSPSHKRLVRLAHDIAVVVTAPAMLDTYRKLGLFHTNHYRAFGIVFGLWSDMVEGNAAREAEERMFALWEEFVRRSPDDKEIAPLLQRRINPYKGSQKHRKKTKKKKRPKKTAQRRPSS